MAPIGDANNLCRILVLVVIDEVAAAAGVAVVIVVVIGWTGDGTNIGIENGNENETTVVMCRLVVMANTSIPIIASSRRLLL